MVWFQCEDCGENLKKPKLSGHFRMCSAFKLSCIDCGQVFSQQAVQGHTQCISEAVAALEEQQKHTEGNTDDEGKETGTDMNAADPISKSDSRYENPDINDIPMDEDQISFVELPTEVEDIDLLIQASQWVGVAYIRQIFGTRPITFSIFLSQSLSVESFADAF